MALLDAAKAYYTGWKFNRTTLGKALALHTEAYFYSATAMSHFSQPNKDKIVTGFYELIASLSQAEDSALACRLQLANYTLALCGLSVLCLTEDEKSDQFYAANPYISGALWRHIDRATENNEDAAQFKWANPDATTEELVAFCNARSALMLYYANGLNMVRIEMGDTDPQKDWFKPFVEAMMVWEEDKQRDKLGLERLAPGAVHGLPYMSFLNYVTAGERNPFFKWTRDWPDRYLGGEGPLDYEPVDGLEDFGRIRLEDR